MIRRAEGPDRDDEVQALMGLCFDARADRYATALVHMINHSSLHGCLRDCILRYPFSISSNHISITFPFSSTKRSSSFRAP